MRGMEEEGWRTKIRWKEIRWISVGASN